VADIGSVTVLLAACWHEFGGGDSERMHAGKVGRMETVRWDPPVLSFRIERHGAMGAGSTRAGLQEWRVDLDRKTAQCKRRRSYRQAPSARGRGQSGANRKGACREPYLKCESRAHGYFGQEVARS